MDRQGPHSWSFFYPGTQNPESVSLLTKKLKEDDSVQESKRGDFVGFGSLMETEEFSDIELIVGPESVRQTFKLHKAILAQNSGYFRRILKANTFIESQTGRIDLPEHTPLSFGIMIYWLYHGKIRKPDKNRNTLLPFHAIVQLVRNAIYFDIPSLQTAAIQECIAHLRLTHLHTFYGQDGKGAKWFVTGLRVLFELYPTHATLLDGIISTLCSNNWLPRILTDPELRPLLQEEPDLMGRIIEIQAGIETPFVFPEEPDDTEQVEATKNATDGESV